MQELRAISGDLFSQAAVRIDAANRSQAFLFNDESLRLGCQMSSAILATVLGRAVTLFASCVELATPRLTRAPEPSRQALVPMVKMLSMRRDHQGLHGLASLVQHCLKCCNLVSLAPDQVLSLRLAVIVRIFPDRLHGHFCNAIDFGQCVGPNLFCGHARTCT